MVLWFTGLSGAGKTTLSQCIAARLRKDGHSIFILDGDSARANLCSDLGYSMEDRRENVRRLAACARLAEDSGHIVCVACISPLREHRELARNTAKDFHEIYVKANIEECIKRDPKGNYKKHIPGYTGIDSKYEDPEAPNLVIETGCLTISEATEKIYKYISPFII